MRNGMLAIFLAAGSAAFGQFTLLPQVGFENSKTIINLNNLQSFSPSGCDFTPVIGLRLDYRTKSGHGVYAGVGNSRNAVNFNFTDPENVMTSYKATTGPVQVRMELGYQFNTKAIKLGSSSAKSATGKSCITRTSRCGSNKGAEKKKASKSNWLKLQPSVGLAYSPAEQATISLKNASQPMYEYVAGQAKMGLSAATGVEFGRGSNRLLTVSLHYYKGFSNLGEEKITTVTGTKTTTTSLSSETAGWGLKIGIPFSLSKTNKQTRHKTEEKKCGEKKVIYRCGTRI